MTSKHNKVRYLQQPQTKKIGSLIDNYQVLSVLIKRVPGIEGYEIMLSFRGGVERTLCAKSFNECLTNAEDALNEYTDHVLNK